MGASLTEARREKPLLLLLFLLLQKPSSMDPRLCNLVLCLILAITPSSSQNDPPLDAPQQIRLEKDLTAQILSVTWPCDRLQSTFDIEIFRTDFMDIVLNETVELSSHKSAGECHWNWTSSVPLECVSHSLRIRARNGPQSSDWSTMQTINGNDFPDSPKAKMYPVDKVVMAGSNTTFCCILEEGKALQAIRYRDQVMKHVRISRRSYAVTQTFQPPSNSSGTNVYCMAENVARTGTVIYVGYPPGDEELECESQDLVSAVCQWKEGRPTHLMGKWRATRYTLNGRECKIVKNTKRCSVEKWETNWTLVARNPLGVKELTDTAPLTHRVHPVAPKNLRVVVKNARNATLQWQYDGFEAFPLTCEVNVTCNGAIVTHSYSGAGLSLALLEDLLPYETYGVRVRCAALNNFWKWSDWSAASFRTRMDRPETPDMWIWMGSDYFGQVLWKPLSGRDSHGELIGYQITQTSTMLVDEEQEQDVPVSQHSVPVNLNFSLTANNSLPSISLVARNAEWLSYPTKLVPKYWPDLDVTERQISGDNGGFDVSWLASANASNGYVVEWFNTSCSRHCSVDWLKVSESTTSARIESAGLLPGVRYTLSVYALSDEAPHLLERWHGYVEEMVPAEAVRSLEASQYESSVLLSWHDIPLQSQRGFIRGFAIYLASVSGNTLLANITDPNVRNFTTSKLGLGTYKFTIRAYTAAGEDGGTTVAIKLEPYTDLLLFELFISLAAMSAFLIVVVALCYKKRQWVKKAFYPEIPEPKLPGHWSTSQATLDVKPAPHSMVHIVENPQWDSSKEGLVPLSEEDSDSDESGSEPIDVDTDSDEPGLLRYYNQVVGHSGSGQVLPHPHSRLPATDSSSSSVGSADTDVTYTGIQTSPCAPEPLTQDLIPPSTSEAGGYRPQVQSGQLQLQQETEQSGTEESNVSTSSPALFGSYKPQCTWGVNSPDVNGFDGSVGSPTSVNSSQFLIPDEDGVSTEDSRTVGSSTTWMPSFLSGKH